MSPTSTTELKKTVLKTLREIPKFPWRTDTRLDARPVGEKRYYGFCLGSVRQLDKGIVPSRFNPRFPQLLKEACALMKAHDPNFKYTSIQVNKNMQCAPHRDAGNEGPSYIIGLGDYQGGDLVVQETSGPKTHNVHNRFVHFDGRLVHHVLPFKGERYTLVFFTVKKPNPRPPAKVS